MANMTAREQLMLELINRARMDPRGEADRLDVTLETRPVELGVATGTGQAARQPRGIAQQQLVADQVETGVQRGCGSHGGGAEKVTDMIRQPLRDTPRPARPQGWAAPSRSTTFSSTLRFSSWPSTVVLSAIGMVSPKPAAVIRPASMPLPIR